MTALSKAARIILINLLVVLVLLALLEGGASLLFTAHAIVRTPGVPEHHHAEHDELLGWVNRPNVHLRDMYGEGIYLRTNAQRFRNNEDVPRAVPVGKTRIICSGDSFTLGFGVDNDHTWCHRLAATDPRLETVNMGQGGYGVDQAYLWYMRDGTVLDHDVHLFAFLTDDFDRMRSDRFMGYGRPLLELRGDSLVVANYPVPRTSAFAHWRALHGETIARLSVVRLVRRLFGLGHAAPGPALDAPETQQLRQVVSRLFEQLGRANEMKQSRLVLVYFPGLSDFKGTPETEDWRGFVAGEAARRKIPLVDLVEEIRRVPPTEVDRLFAPNAHFSVAGNEWAARAIHQRLGEILDRPPPRAPAEPTPPVPASRGGRAAQKTGMPSPSVQGRQGARSGSATSSR